MIYRLGKYGLLVEGDSTDELQVNRLQQAAISEGLPCAEIIITDPPYGVNLGSQRKVDLEKRGRKPTRNKNGHPFMSFAIENDSLDNESLLSLWEGALSLGMNAFMCERLLMFFSNTKLYEVAKLGDRLGLPIRSLLIWIKEQAVISWCEFNPQNECILYAGTTDIRRRNKNRGQSNVFFCKKNSLTNTTPWYHPTSKPLPLLRDLLDATTIAGDCVYDPFSGTGSLMTAALRTGRFYLGAELSRRFVLGSLLRFMYETAEQEEVYSLDAGAPVAKQALLEEYKSIVPPNEQPN